MADINQIKIGDSTYDIDAKTLNGKNITVSDSAPTASDGVDGDLWFAPSTGGGGLSLTEMTVTDRAAIIPEPGIYIVYGQAYASSSYSTSYYVSSIMVVPSDAPSQIRSFHGTGSSNIVSFTYTKSTGKITMATVDAAGTGVKGVIKCYQLAKL